MVPVHTVFNQELPVGAHAIGLRTGDDFHPGLGLVTHQIEVLPGASEIVHQTLNMWVEADKDKIAVDLDPGWADEPEFLTVEGSTVRVVSGHTDEAPLVI